MPDLSQVFSPQQLAEAITSKRTNLGLRLVDVAANIGISKHTLVKIEKGDTRVSLKNLLLVMEYLGLTFAIRTDEPSLSNLAQERCDEDWF
jgi:transcriptional regulator with XRE-family HTH domain